jgi:serine/threonine-protein kinase HipA
MIQIPHRIDLAQVGKAVSKWRAEAARHGLTKQEIDRMASAFQHEDLQRAIAGR